MMKYSEIKLTDDERKLLEVLKNSGVTEIKRDFCGTLIVRKNQYGTVLQFFDGFDWMDYNDEYEIDKLLNPPHEPKTVWELEKSDKYCVLNEYGNVVEYIWHDDNADKKLRRQGNAFLTREEAKFEAKRREVVTKVRKYARPFKHGGNNWHPFYDHHEKLISACQTESYSQFPDLFFEHDRFSFQYLKSFLRTGLLS